MKLFVFYSVLVIIFFGACKKENTDPTTILPTPTFIVSNKEEQMPVWVEGKADANTILLAVHGGPGSDVLDFRNYQNGTGFKEIEKEYLIAYWQQRASGQSIGADNKANYNIAQYVEDCDKVVDELIAKYPSKKIVLFGHSWGGMLTSSYLSHPSRQEKIVAWIDAAGVHDGTMMSAFTQKDLIEEATARIAKNENTSFWQEVKGTAEKGEFTQINNLAYSVVSKINEVPIKVNENNTDFKFTTRAINSNDVIFNEILVKDNTQTLVNNFNKPILFLWGKYDFAVSKKLRDNLIPKLRGNPVTSIKFDASGHYMMFHEPTKFAYSVVNFIKTL